MNKITIGITIATVLIVVAGAVIYVMNDNHERGHNDPIDEGKILTVYFTWSNTTEQMADYIHGKVGGDIVRLNPTDPYPYPPNEANYQLTADRAKQERDSDSRPTFENLGVNPEDYDTIFIGYPIWWYTVPMIINTFFDSYDLSGKTIVPFNTHQGSRDGGTYDHIRELEPNAKVCNGIFIHNFDTLSDSIKKEIDEWLAELGFE